MAAQSGAMDAVPVLREGELRGITPLPGPITPHRASGDVATAAGQKYYIKGGFVQKKAPPASDREAFMKDGVACYQDYLRGLLDLTDNRVGDKIVPPPAVRRHALSVHAGG